MSLSGQLNGFIRSAAKLVSLKAIATYLGNAAEKFNSYYEAANLFGVSMKGLTGEASTFINKMETLLGIDPTEAMNNMATIQGLTTSFGIASDKAYVLSKNLTQLGYDLASLKISLLRNPLRRFRRLFPANLNRFAVWVSIFLTHGCNRSCLILAIRRAFLPCLRPIRLFCGTLPS